MVAFTPMGEDPLPPPSPRGDTGWQAVSALLTQDIAQFFAKVRHNALNHADIRPQGTVGMRSQ